MATFNFVNINQLNQQQVNSKLKIVKKIIAQMSAEQEKVSKQYTCHSEEYGDRAIYIENFVSCGCINALL